MAVKIAIPLIFKEFPEIVRLQALADAHHIGCWRKLGLLCSESIFTLKGKAKGTYTSRAVQMDDDLCLKDKEETEIPVIAAPRIGKQVEVSNPKKELMMIET
ncbi:hypothetical protein RND71_000902 [Anisodus tanguticus]|uniref:Uncharacterized protein n=1 Tax=Anisodus tanguticus TaxID=243964 RepID=A0AAE1T0C8_9SOLA|nr:hypothetical protein RND71_000902 [Anisodus tanguticus]